MGFLDSLRTGLGKTKQALVEKVTEVITGRKPLEESLYEELEEVLIQADVGVNTTLKLVDSLREKAREHRLEEAGQLRRYLEEEISQVLKTGDHRLKLETGTLNVILVVGVNGVGKTTSLGKLAHLLRQQGLRVVVAAGDTFRAGAIEQLAVWCRRAGVDLVRQKEGADPAAVVYDSLQVAKARKADCLLVDTAGRLQTKTNLMEELKKIRRVIDREVPSGLREVLLVLDATTGQNALSQARLFKEAVGVTGVILTKLDGTAKGGVILGIQNEYNLPVKYIGVGEKIEDFQEFVPEDFSAALFGEKEEEE